MDPRRWEEMRALFDELVELDEARRMDRLSSIGAADPELRERLGALLAADDRADSRLKDVESPFLPQDPPDPYGFAGLTLSHFRVIERLGRGGMGVVYRAEDVRLGREVALKFLLPHHRLDPSAKARFLQEARSAGALDHPNICTVYEIGESEDGHLFLAMPLYAGETLDARLAREGSLPIQEVARLGVQIASGLERAHAAGIVHRDLKPGNLMLLPDGTLKILDFGLAKVQDLSLTGSDIRVGTVAYMAPEQIRGDPVDARTDLWAVGVLLYEMLTGVRPFGQDQEARVLHAILYQAPAAPGELCPEVPRSLAEIVRCLLEKDPEMRVPTAAELRQQLSGHPPVARPRLAPGSRWRASNVALRRWAARNRVAAGALAVAVGGGAVAGVVALRNAAEGARAAVGRLQSIAVLPFDYSGGEAHENFGDQMAEAIQARLSSATTLTVIPFASVLGYRDTRKTNRELGEELGVDAVLRGRVVLDGERIAVSARLIDTRTNEELWKDEYARPMGDVFTLQAAIASRVVDEIQDEVSPEQRLRLARTPTDNITASELHAKATRSLYEYRDVGDVEEAMSLYRQAIRLDSSYAEAYAGLSRAHRIRSALMRTGVDSAIYFGKRAVQVDSSVSDGYAALGRAYAQAGRLEEGWRELNRALARNPSDLQAAYGMSLVSEELNRLDEALRWAKRARDLDRTQVEMYATVGRIYMALDDLGVAEQWLLMGLAMDADNASCNTLMALIHIARGQGSAAVPYIRTLEGALRRDNWSFRQLGLLWLAFGDHRKAIEYYERADSLAPDADPLLEHGYAYLRAGERRKAEEIFAPHELRLRAEVLSGNATPETYTELAMLYAARGDGENALLNLGISYERGARDLYALVTNPMFDSIRASARFQQIVSKTRSAVTSTRFSAEEGAP